MSLKSFDVNKMMRKNMAETVSLQIPEALYQRLAIASGATQRSLARKLT